MPEKDVRAIFHKAVNDEAFRIQMNKDVDTALEVHQLDASAEERKALREIEWETIFSENFKSSWVHIYSTAKN